MATADEGAKPIVISKGGNRAGVTTPSEVRKDPNPMPTYKARTSSPTTCCLMTFETILNAPTSFIMKIINMVAATEIEIPKLFKKPTTEAPNTTSVGVSNRKTAKMTAKTKPTKDIVKPLCRNRATPNKTTNNG